MEIHKNPLHDFVNKAVEYKKEIAAGVIGLALIGVAIVGYIMYQNRREAKAHRAWVSTMKEFYNAPLKTEDTDVTKLTLNAFGSEAEKWEATAKAYHEAYNQHAGTQLGPYFLVMQAEALRNLGNLEKAIATLDTAVSGMTSPQVRDAYTIKLALMKMDSSSDQLVEQGLNTLTEIAGKDSHISHDYVLYELGSYYWSQKKFAEVKNYWKMLLLKYSDVSKAPSPWAALVKEKLNLVESE